ncbi:TIGR03086 family protein [Mycobacterium sp. PS03-16]|uniref:TIGR03086 family metal-binding protein n=1 Tax=Mycobacterium sp. PS03-16 TaxID=2559611 RepID=UPI0010747A5F|nr:TIGR03086 family metal-binding protein [Mycobacterium sp. PS03-16]TFV56281.1 TIGR03086 family protein [Mycobacterium sp. PS03-16]
MIDLTSACERTAGLVASVPDDALGGATPNESMTVRDLVAHIGGLSAAFTAAARKDLGEWTDTPPDEHAPLDDGWRSLYPQRLTALAQAWRDADAWTGMTRAGGVDLPGQVAGAVALAEVVIHGWDLAVATGRHYDCDEPTAHACLEHLAQFDPAGTEGLFGPAVPVDGAAPAIERIVGLSGRDPHWRA